MASFSTSLEQALRRALQYANERSHEYATLEHLLLSLLDDRDAAAVMRACDVDIDALRDKLTGYVDNELVGLVLDSRATRSRRPRSSASSIAPWPMCNLRAARR